jgi:DNA polymerase-3 subunit alpha
MLSGRYLKQFENILQTYRSVEGLPVAVEYQRDDAAGAVRLGDNWRVDPSDELILALKEHFGDESIMLEY